jgi:heat shock protein 5
LDSEQKNTLQQIITDGSHWVEEYGPAATAEEIEDKLQEIQDIANPIISSLRDSTEETGDDDDEWRRGEL